MSEQDNIDLFAAWLEGKLTPSQQSQFEALCTSNRDFAKRVEQANFASMLNETSPPLEVPNWNKEASFQYSPASLNGSAQRSQLDSQQSARWWQWQGLPMTSFACSIIAIVMVTTGFSVEVSEGRVSMGFSQNEVNDQDIAALVDTRIANYQQTNQVLFAQYIEAMQSQQMQANTQLTEYLLGSSRKERREDFAELIKFVNEQRRDDQNFYARQINDLKQDIDLYGTDTYGSGEANSMLIPFVPNSDTAINE